VVDIDIMVLSPEDNLLFLSNNLSKQDSRILRSLCDLAELFKKYDGILDWDYIINPAHYWNV
jgi:hypothetical protein